VRLSVEVAERPFHPTGDLPNRWELHRANLVVQSSVLRIEGDLLPSFRIVLGIIRQDAWAVQSKILAVEKIHRSGG